MALANSRGRGMLGTQDTDNQTDSGQILWSTLGALGQCQLYIQRAHTLSQTGAHWGTDYCTYRAGEGGGWSHKAQTTRQIVGKHSGAHWGTGAISTINTEGTDNQPDRGSVGLCTYRGHWQLVGGGGFAHWGTLGQ